MADAMAARYTRGYYLRLDPELADGLKALKERDGVGESETIRRAIRAWLEAKGVRSARQKTERKRAGTRKRP
jgi:predicted DNA-binding protein